MKQKTRHLTQRVAAGILASILTLSGITAAHAGEKGKLLTECKPYTVYTFGYGDGNNVEGGTWNITGANLNGNSDDSFAIPVNRPDIPHLPDEEFSTDSADYRFQWVQQRYYQSEYVATTDNCTFIHGYQFQPSLTISAHQGVTLTEETVRADLRKQYPNVLGHSLDYYFPQFVVQSPTRWVNPENNYYHVDERIQLDGSVHVFNLHRIGQPAEHGRTPAAFGFEDSFFRFPHNSNRVEKLEGDTWVTVARTPFVFETVTNLANRGVVMVEPDRRTSHFVRFEDLTRGDLSHAVTSTATVDYGGEQVSPFSDDGFNNQGLYTVDASQILRRNSELVNSENLSGVVDDFSRQLGESLPQLLSTSLEYAWAIPANATPEKQSSVPELPTPETTLCFHPQGGSLGSLPVDNLGVHCLILHSGESVQLPSPVRPGYEFAGWYLNPEGTGEQITKFSEYDAHQSDNYGNRSVDLYAQWKNANLSVKVEAQTPVLATEQRTNSIQYRLTPQHSDGQAYDATFTLIYEGNNWVKEKQASKHITLSDSAQTVEFTPADFGWDTAPEHYGFQPGTYTYELTAGDIHVPAYSDADNETVVSVQGMSHPDTHETTEDGLTYHVTTHATAASGYYQFTLSDQFDTTLPFTISHYQIVFPEQGDMTGEFTVDTSVPGQVVARWNHQDWEVPTGNVTIDYDITFPHVPQETIGHTVTVDNGVETVRANSSFPARVHVLFDVNGGTGGISPLAVYPYSTQQLASVSKPSRAGYVFTGWATTPTGEPVSTVTPTKDMTLYAQWRKGVPMTDLQPAHKTTRTIHFTSTSPCEMEKTITGVDGDTLSTPAFTCDGYQLTGWSVHNSKGVREFDQPHVSFPVEGDMTVYAQWKKSVPMTDLQPAHKTEKSVRFHSNDKRNTVITVHATDGDSVSSHVGLTRDGYVLTGWATTPDGKPSVTPDARISVNGDMDWYAVWKPVSEPQKPANPSHTPASTPSSTPAQKTVQPAGEQRSLALTGANVGLVGLLAVLAVTLGGVLLLVGRKRG